MVKKYYLVQKKIRKIFEIIRLFGTVGGKKK